MEKVTKDTVIGEVLRMDEGVAPILMKAGMHCLGCPSAQMETLGEAEQAHGLEADVLVSEINEFFAQKA